MSCPHFNINIAPTIQQSPYHGPRRQSSPTTPYIAQHRPNFLTQSYGTIHQPSPSRHSTPTTNLNTIVINTANLLEENSMYTAKSNNDSVYCDDSISLNISELLEPYDNQSYTVGDEEEGIELLLAKVESALRLEVNVMNVLGFQQDENEEDSDLVLMKTVNDALKGKDGTSAADVYLTPDAWIPRVPLQDGFGGTGVDQNVSPAYVFGQSYASSAPSPSRFEASSSAASRIMTQEPKQHRKPPLPNVPFEFLQK
ncbi:UNVERIFIED_CONTAM: hypothetical protein HDU68_000368 [Siphonaria sp. JEL0065]|nr:hypothetical protein HDU68_000368 [Siphonaria sp. JEL0065]